MPELKPENIKRVVVRGTNWVGDAVMTVPALNALRRLLPDAHITLATRSFAKAIFDDVDCFDDFLVYDSRPGRLRSALAQARKWQTRRFDLAILFPNAFEPALVALLGRVRFRIGYATQGRKVLLTHPINLPEWRNSRHESFYYLNIISELDQLLNGQSRILEQPPALRLNVGSNRRLEALDFLRAQGVRRGHPLIALCPGSINSRAKRWMEHEPIVLTGKTDLAQAAAVLNDAELLVTHDTGPAHLAAALGRPTLVIFGPTNPLTTRPLSPSAEIVRQAPDCAPCMLRDCPIDHRCMTAITPDEVFERAAAMLGPKVSEKLRFVAH